MGFVTIDNAIKLSVLIFILLGIYYLINIGNKYIESTSKLDVSKGRIIRFLLISTLLIVLYLLWTNFPIMGQVLAIFIGSVVFSYLIVPAVRYFEIKLEERSIPRGWAIIIVYVLILAFFGILLGIIIPSLGKEFIKFVISLPELLNEGSNFVEAFIERFDQGQSRPMVDLVVNEMDKFARQMVNGIQDSFFHFVSGLTNRIPGIASKLIIIAIVPVVSFYMIHDRKDILARLRKFLLKNKGQRVLDFGKDLNAAMSDFVRGRIIMAAFVGVCTSIVMFLLGLDFAIVIGLITGVADIIPYVGPFLGFIPAFVMAWAQSPVKGIIMAVSFYLLQWLENNVLGPKVLSDSVGLHPVVILLCIFIGASVGGVLGMIFLIPIVLALKIVVEHLEPELKMLWDKIANKNMEDL